MKKKRTFILIFTIFLLLAVVIFTVCYFYMKKQEYFIEESFEEGEQELDNPARGFYQQIKTEDIWQLSEVKKDQIRLVLAAFDIIAYRECRIPEEKLKELDDFLTELQKLGLQAIFRAAYGFSPAECNDADSMDRIQEHILQIASILNKHKEVIYCVQAGFLGTWGEWHNSIFLEGKTEEEQIENRNNILKMLLEKLDASIIINVRRPRFIRDARRAGLDTSRVGYHDDGLLASDDDLGTYDEKNYDRQAELIWLEKRFVEINGGEMPMLSKYTEPDTAIQEFLRIHLSYLNIGYNTEVLSSWKTGLTKEENNAYEYIKNHLGYRLYMSKISYRETWRTGVLTIWIKNKGFSFLPKRYQAELLLKSKDNLTEITETVELDAEKIQKLGCDMETMFTVKIPKEFLRNSFQIGLKLYDSLDDQNFVELANEKNHYENGMNDLWEIVRMV